MNTRSSYKGTYVVSAWANPEVKRPKGRPHNSWISQLDRSYHTGAAWELARKDHQAWRRRERETRRPLTHVRNYFVSFFPFYFASFNFSSSTLSSLLLFSSYSSSLTWFLIPRACSFLFSPLAAFSPPFLFIPSYYSFFINNISFNQAGACFSLALLLPYFCLFLVPRLVHYFLFFFLPFIFFSLLTFSFSSLLCIFHICLRLFPLSPSFNFFLESHLFPIISCCHCPFFPVIIHYSFSFIFHPFLHNALFIPSWSSVLYPRLVILP